MSEHPIAPGAIVDMHAHLYPEGCFDEMVRARPEFALTRSERGIALTCRGSHTMSAMSAPLEEALTDRVRTMDEAGVAVAAVASVTSARAVRCRRRGRAVC